MGVNTGQTLGGPLFSSFLPPPSSLSPSPPPLIQLGVLGEHLEAKIRGQISYIFKTELKCTARDLFYDGTNHTIMMTKIVHHTRDCVEIIAGVQHSDRPLPDPCRTSAVLTPML